MKQRLVGFDLLRGLTVTLMVFINFFDEAANHALLVSSLGRRIDLAVTSIVPNVFVFLFGFFIIFTNKFTWRHLLKRGLIILLIGYGINLIRYPLMLYIGGHADTLADSFQEYGSYLHLVDIYLFIGYACLILVLFSLLPKIDSRAYAALATVIIYLSMQYEFAESVLNLLPEPIARYAIHIALPSSPKVYFPFVPWLTYLFIGLAAGVFYRQVRPLEFFKKLTFTGLALAIAGSLLVRSQFDLGSFNMLQDFYQHDYRLGVMLMGLTLLMPVLAEFFLTKLPKKLQSVLIFSSKHVMFIYIFSWLLTCFGTFVLRWWHAFDLTDCLLYSFYIYITCLLCAACLKKLKILK